MKNRMKIALLLSLMLMVVGCGREGKALSRAAIGSNQPFKEVPVEMNDLEEVKLPAIEKLNELSYQLLLDDYQQGKEGNSLSSPLSLYLALSMLQNGAVGEAKDQILQLLGDEGTINEDNRLLISYLSSLNGKELGLQIANSFWVKVGLKPKQTFVDRLSENYDAEMFSVNFADAKTLELMNLWVEDNTNGLLKETFSELPDPELLSILMNTVYFKGKWAMDFSEGATRAENFYLENGDFRLKEMMNNNDSFNYYESEDCQIIHLPYEGNMEMVVLLPKTDMASWMEGLSGKELQELMKMDQTSNKKVRLRLPKFEYEVSMNLKGFLESMGITKVFQVDNQELSEIIEDDDSLYVSKIFQNAKIIVDEAGTEAAAVTVIEMNTTAMLLEEEPVEMICNKPFVYVIRDTKMELPLFVGMFQGE